MLLGRDAERRAIETLLSAARVADSRGLVLSGEPGVGKTSLLDFAARAASGMRVLRAAGIESERHVPFAGLLQLLRPLLAHLPELPAPQSAALESALALRAALPEGPSRFAVGAATLGLLARAAEDQPLAVLVDDGHLVDAPTVEALVFAARRMLSDAVAVLVAVRSTESGAAAWEPLPHLPVSGLDLAAAEQLLSEGSRPVRRDEVARLHEATAGNPLALLELRDRWPQLDGTPAASPVAVPQELARSFLHRVEGLSADARSALLVAAADGASVRAVDAACRALGTSAAALDEARDAGLVVVDGDTVTFRHPLVRSAVYGAADSARRREVHRALARAVPVTEVHRLAWHLSEGAVPPDEPTARTLDSVAEQAAARGAHATAADAYARAAELSADDDAAGPRLAAAGEAAWLAGRTSAATAHLARAAGTPLTGALRTHVHEVRGAVETRAGSLEVALGELVAAARGVEDVDPSGAVRLYSDAVHVAFYLLDPRPAVGAATAIERLLDRVEDEATSSLGVLAAGMAKVMSGTGAEGVALLRDTAYRLVSQAAEPRDPFRLPLRVQGALWLRDADPDRDVVASAVQQMREEAALGSMPYLLMQVGRDAATTDRWADAETAYLEAARLARETGQTTDLAVSLAGLAIVVARRGRSEELASVVQEALPFARRHAVRLAEVWLLFAQGDAAAGAGDPGGAAGHYEALEGVLTSNGFADPDQSCAPELVEVYLQLGRDDDAAVVAATLAARASAKGTAWSLARSARARALCATDAGTAEQWFRAALEHHRHTPDRYELARTALAFGARLRRDRRRVEARPLLRQALDVFEELGAAPWAEQAARELAATGETVVRRDVDEREALTPQERQVAQLLAEGRTTRQAAAALFLSPKTVEYHLRHVYLKLGIRSRTELAERFG